MTWTGTGSRIPASVRKAVRRRDGDRCQLGYPGCTGYYEELDHIENLASTGTDRRSAAANDPAALQCVCRNCHKVKTGREAMAARGLATIPAERDHRLGRVETPPGFRYAPR